VRHGIAIIPRYRQRRSLFGLLDRALRQRAPPIQVVEPVGKGEEGVRRGEVRVQFDGTLQKVAGIAVRLLRQPVPQLPATQEAIIRFGVPGLPRRKSLPIALCQVDRQRADDLLRDIVLNPEYVGEVAIEPLRP
jgi:hypothetical protein